jgi:alkanesulfonate monooxygenase SsuD/methylene tetrahydromethanopterin reductase-like flavin-dependent oxidoreductase (luciferase family)
MTSIGYALSGEEHRPGDLVEHARLAEARGFEFALISDHFHPWTDRQGQSPFVWGVLGAIANATDRLRVGTGVTALEWWRTAAIHGNASLELALPEDFEALAALVDEDAIAEAIPRGPDPRPILDAIGRYVDAGFDHVYLHQVGPDQAGFLQFAAASLPPEFETRPAAAATAAH